MSEVWQSEDQAAIDMDVSELIEAEVQKELAVAFKRKISAGLPQRQYREPPFKIECPESRSLPGQFDFPFPRKHQSSSRSGSEVTHNHSDFSGPSFSLDPRTLAAASVSSRYDKRNNRQEMARTIIKKKEMATARKVASTVLQRIQNIYYLMILPLFGFGINHKKMNCCLTRTSPKTSTCSFRFASDMDICNLSITHKLDGIMHGSPESLVALIQKSRLLTRGINGIIGKVSTDDTNKEPALPVFAFDDLTYSGHDKVTRITKQRIPTQAVEPIYLLPTAINNLLILDLSGCSGLGQVPACLVTLHNLVALNLSCCYSLHTLPASLGTLQNLQILLLSCCYKLKNLPVSLCNLSILRLLDLSGCSSLEVLPESFVNLGFLEILNLSDCNMLKELPQPFSSLRELKYLNLSSCHGLDLDVEYLHRLANLKCLTLSPITEFRSFPDSLQDIANYLDRSRWWKRNRFHPQCNSKAASLHLYGFHKQSILDMLLSDGFDEGYTTSDQIVTSICIVGESGLGKTELVHQIYNDQMILDAFNLRIWLYMHGKKTLLESMAEFTNCANCSNAPLSVIEEIVLEEITGKRLLLVLDDSDIKSQYFWGDVRKLLSVCAKRSAFIVTTKSKEVANLMRAVQTYYLSSLSKEECFMIFKGHVLGGLHMSYDVQLESIGWKVVEKCGGNSLCAKALCGLLCHSEIGLDEIDMLVDGILPALRFCYDLLPAHLKQCFKFCSLFPKDYIFIKHHIVQLWISQGYVFCEEGSQLEDTGLHYFDELFCRSFFQSSPFHNDQDDKFVMHELFHELATSVSKNELMRCEEPFCCLPENTSHLSLVLSDFKSAALTKVARNLQCLLVVRGSFPVVRILHLNDLYVKFEFLRALNLSYTDMLELPSSIGNMKHLRFLALNSTKIKGLPFEIGQVDALQTLELKDCCHLIDLPASTSNLVMLRHLDVRKEAGNVKVIMPHGIGQLTGLQTLTEFNIGNNLPHCSIAELKNLNGLRGHVHVTGLENIKTADDAREANIVGKHLLEALTLEWSYSNESMDDGLGQEIANKILQNLQPNSNLQKLDIRNYAGNLFPLWMQCSYLSKLVSVTLDNCYNCSELPYLGDLPSLKSLFIQRMNSVERFGIGSSSLAKHPPRFPSLEVLILWEMYDLQFWVGTSEWDFPRIYHLSISRCPKLINFPPLLSLVNLSVHCGSQVPSFEEFPSLESLKIEGFHKVRSISFPHQLKSLKKLEISDCKELSSMFAYFLSVSNLRVVRCLKLDLVGCSLEDNHSPKVDDGRNNLTRMSMVLKSGTYTNLQGDSWKWEKHGEKNVFGYNLARSYYKCLHRNLTRCCAMKILQPNDTDPNMLSAMYIYEHNHEFPIEPHLELSTELGTTH